MLEEKVRTVHLVLDFQMRSSRVLLQRKKERNKRVLMCVFWYNVVQKKTPCVITYHVIYILNFMLVPSHRISIYSSLAQRRPNNKALMLHLTFFFPSHSNDRLSYLPFMWATKVS